MVDWSRAARNERKLMEAAEDVNQTHITDYYSILDDIGTLAKKNEHLLALLQCQQLEQCSFTPVLKQIIANAEKNASRLSVGVCIQWTDWTGLDWTGMNWNDL